MTTTLFINNKSRIIAFCGKLAFAEVPIYEDWHPSDRKMAEDPCASGRRDTRCALIGGRYTFKLYFRLAGAGRCNWSLGLIRNSNRLLGDETRV